MTDQSANVLANATKADLVAELRRRGHLVFLVANDDPQPGWAWDDEPGGWAGWLEEHAEGIEDLVYSYLSDTLDNMACNTDVPNEDEEE